MVVVVVVVVVVTIYKCVLGQDQAFWSALQLDWLAWLAWPSVHTYLHTQTTTTTNGHTQCYTSLIITINNINYVTGNINYQYCMTVWYITIEDTIWSLWYPGHIIIITPCYDVPDWAQGAWCALACVNTHTSALHSHSVPAATANACIQEIEY